VLTPSTTNPPETTLPQPEFISNATPEQIVAVVSDISAEEAEEVFAQIEVSELTEEQQQALVEAVQEAPTEVREAFEEKVDIFKEGLDDSIPTGSNIPVGERRALIAIGAAITAAGATRIRR
jgi:TRAP-type C4-dicarboxylate transport system substrate-binding protein